MPLVLARTAGGAGKPSLGLAHLHQWSATLPIVTLARTGLLAATTMFALGCTGIIDNGGGPGDGDGDDQGPGDGDGDSDGQGPGDGLSPLLEGCAIFPADNPWNSPIDQLSVHPQSADFVASIGADRTMHPDFGTEWQGAPLGIPFVVATDSTTLIPVSFDYASESDPGPYPIPSDSPIEGGPDASGDRHVLVLQKDSCEIFELFDAWPSAEGWRAGSGARFDLSSNETRPDGWTSADAAGLPILPGLVRYDEVVGDGEVRHAVRITVRSSQDARIAPATHAAGSGDSSLPPMGLRLRLKSDYSCSAYSSEVQVLCTAFKRYGVIVADNGSSWYVSGAPDPRWDDDALRDLKSIPGSAFEAVDSGPIEPM